jgi:hypothetical protein
VIFIWGSDRGMARVCQGEQADCPNCRRVRRHSYFVVYRYMHLYYELGLVTRREYVLACETCRHGVTVDSAAVPPSETGKDPIPLLRRWGCLGFVIALSTILITLTAIFVAINFR